MNDGDSKYPRGTIQQKKGYVGSSGLGRIPVEFVQMERKKNTKIGTCELYFCGKGTMENFCLKNRLVSKDKDNIS